MFFSYVNYVSRPLCELKFDEKPKKKKRDPNRKPRDLCTTTPEENYITHFGPILKRRNNLIEFSKLIKISFFHFTNLKSHHDNTKNGFPEKLYKITGDPNFTSIECKYTLRITYTCYLN